LILIVNKQQTWAKYLRYTSGENLFLFTTNNCVSQQRPTSPTLKHARTDVVISFVIPRISVKKQFDEESKTILACTRIVISYILKT